MDITQKIDQLARIDDLSVLGDEVEVREFATIRYSLLGSRVMVYERVSLKGCFIADNVMVNAGTYIINTAIGTGTMIGPNCSIVGVWHEILPMEIKREDLFTPIRIGAGCLIGASVTIVPGISIGEGAAIGAGAVISKNVDPYQVVWGPPERQRRMTRLAYLAGRAE